MAYHSRPTHRYFSGDRNTPIAGEPIFELDESDVWNIPTSPELRKHVPSPRIKNISSPAPAPATALVGRTASSLPVNVPDWSKILKVDLGRRRELEFEDFEYGDDGAGGRIPPHEFLARQKTRTASFSVHEGVGRTLKGRDLSRVRNAVWEKIGFED